MRILYITLNSIETNTSANLRNKALLRGLKEKKVEIDVLTISANKNSSTYDCLNIKLLQSLNIIYANSNNAYLTLTKPKAGIIGKAKKLLVFWIRKVYHYLSMFDNTMRIAKKINLNYLKKSYDLIISSSDPKSSHVTAKYLIDSGLKYGHWIQYWGDPLTADITNKSIYPKWYKKLVEKKLFSNCDDIIYVSPITLENQRTNFSKYSNKMRFVPVPYFQEKIYDLNEKNNFRIGYFGDYNSKTRNIIPLYNVCKENKISSIIVGDSDLELEDTDFLSIKARLPKEKIESLEANCNILVCILNIKGGQIPGKIYHYSATNKPILVILDGERSKDIENYLKSYNRFVFCNNNKSDINKAIEKIGKEEMMYRPVKKLSAGNVAELILKNVQLI